MKRVSILIIALLLAFNSNGHCGAYVVATTTENTNRIGVGIEISEETAVEESRHEHIAKIVHPGEIRVPIFSEQTAFVDAVPHADTSEEIQQASQALTYSDLYKLLALWQLTNDKNFYVLASTKDTGDVYQISGNDITERN